MNAVEKATEIQNSTNTVLGAVKCAEGWHDGQ
jgi:hypothetical protein